MKKRNLALSALALAVSQAYAGTDTWFTPLTESTTVMPPNDVNELTSPWVAPPELKFTNLTSLREVEMTIGESMVRANVELAGRDPNVASMIDMIWFSPDGKYLFLPHETPIGAGLSRYDMKKDITEVIFAGRPDLASQSNKSGCDGDAPIRPKSFGVSESPRPK